MRDHRSPLDALLALALAIAVLASRGIAADTFVSWDEPMWAYRSARFLAALQDGRWRDTLITGHPGVTTMWAGALSFWWHGEVVKDANADAIAAAAAMDGVDVHDAQQMGALGALVPIARQGILVFHAVLAAVLYGLFRQLLPRATALGVSLVLLADPFLLGLSRLLHLDALAAQFMLAAMLALLLYQRRGHWVWLAGSAAATGLAFVTKSYALLLAPCAIVLIATGPASEKAVADWPRRGGHLLLWGAMTWLAVLLVWPAAARMPSQSLYRVLSLALGYASDPGTATSTFFLGERTASPGGMFYPLAWLFRATPLATIGVALAVLTLPVDSLWRDHKEQRRMIVIMFLYGALYAALITLSEKKYDRYLLPAILALDVSAALFLARVLGAISESIGLGEASREWFSGAMLAGCVLLQTVILLGPLAPAHYLAYYNPLAGGLSRAVQTLPVGWGEGMEEAITWLATEADAADATIAAWGVPGIASLHRGNVVTPTPGNLHRAEYVLVYIADVQNREPIAEAFLLREPLYVVRINGEPYVRIYANLWEHDVLEQLGERASPDAVIVTNDHSTLSAADVSPWPLHVIHHDDDRLVAQRLREATSERDELWFIRFEATGADATGLCRAAACISRQLAVEAILLDETPFAYGTLLHYALPTDADFGLAEPDRAIMQDFNGRLCLLAGTFERDVVEHGQAIGVNLLWRAQQVSGTDLSLFLHLIDAQGRRWSPRMVSPSRSGNQARSI